MSIRRALFEIRVLDVNSPYPVALRLEPLHKVMPDKTACSGDDYSHELILNESRSKWFAHKLKDFTCRLQERYQEPTVQVVAAPSAGDFLICLDYTRNGAVGRAS